MSFRTWREDRRRRRQTPCEPPAGYHWEVTRSHFEQNGKPCWADYWLVEDGLEINEFGFYLHLDNDRIRMPFYRAVVAKPSQVRRSTLEEVLRFENDRATTGRIRRMRERGV